MPYLISIIGTIALGLGAAAAYLRLHQKVEWAGRAVVLAGAVAVMVNVAYFARTIHDLGMVETMRHSFDSTLLLATLVGAAGLLTHVSRALRGLDGLLLLGAAVVEFWALLLISQPAGADVRYHTWFVSHSLAFVVSATCFIAGGVAGLAYLLINYLLRKKRAFELVGEVAPLESLERFGRWMLMIGFPLFTYGILTGICELVRVKSPAPGLWMQDPMIWLSFLTWVVYAVLIGSMWVRPEIRGRRAATLSSCAMALVAVVFLVIEFVSPIHR